MQVAGLAAFLLVLTLYLGARLSRTRAKPDIALAGLSLGLLVLTDPILGLCSPALVWLIARRNELASSFRLAGGMIAIAGLVVAPWIVRNYRVHGEFVPVKSTFGYAFWQGNCAISEGTDKVVRGSIEKVVEENRSQDWAEWNRTLWRARHIAGYIDDIALTKSDLAMLGKLSEPARSRTLFRRCLPILPNNRCAIPCSASAG